MIETRPFGDSGSPILVRESDKIGVGALNVAVLVRVAAIMVLRRWMSTNLYFDFACAGILVYLMIMSAINDEYSLEYLGGGF